MTGNVPEPVEAETVGQYRARILGYGAGRDPLVLQATAPEVLASLVHGLSEEQLSRRPAPDKWSIREIVAHLADDELVGGYRIRLILSAPGTPIQAFDQDVWARTGRYGTSDVSESLAVYRTLRSANLSLLHALTPAEWDMSGVHAERGIETVRDIAAYFAGHDINHFRQIEAIRRALQKSGLDWRTVSNRVKAVCFDVGETLVDESRLWRLWAQWLNVSTDAFDTTLKAVIARGEHHAQVFQHFRPGFDLHAALAERDAAGFPPDVFEARDLYPDALPCLRALKAAGYRIGVAGNQGIRSEAVLAEAGVDVDVVASSERWGVEKPSRGFFERLAQELDLEPSRIAYVGDRLDNDVLPAQECGMLGIFIRRGPWGKAHATRADAGKATIRIDDLTELVALRTRPDFF